MFKNNIKHEVPLGMRIYEKRWVDLLKKNEDGSNIDKSIIVVRYFREHQSVGIQTMAPTIYRMRPRFVLYMYAMEHKLVQFYGT